MNFFSSHIQIARMTNVRVRLLSCSVRNWKPAQLMAWLASTPAWWWQCQRRRVRRFVWNSVNKSGSRLARNGGSAIVPTFFSSISFSCRSVFDGDFWGERYLGGTAVGLLPKFGIGRAWNCLYSTVSLVPTSCRVARWSVWKLNGIGVVNSFRFTSDVVIVVGGLEVKLGMVRAVVVS